MKLAYHFSPARWVGVVLLVGMAALLLFIGWRAETDTPHLAQRLTNYRTARILPSTHLSGNEIMMLHMPAEKATVNDCIAWCLENTSCVAANHYLASAGKNAQCWLFQAIDASKLKPSEDCCTLAIIEKRLPKLPLAIP